MIAPFYPNRAVRRAVIKRRESRLPTEWRAFLVARPEFRTYIQLRLV